MSGGGEFIPDWVIWVLACVGMVVRGLDDALDSSAPLAMRIGGAISASGFLYFAVRAWWLP